MPYTKEHKNRTKQRILQSALELFSTKGFSAVTINEIMQHSSLTRGAFYAHFNSKSELYKESLYFFEANNELVKHEPEEVSSKDLLSKFLDEYLSVKHVNGEKPCPLAFMVSDMPKQDKVIREAYVDIYKGVNKVILNYSGSNAPNEKDILSLSSMIIGAVAISRTIDDPILVKEILSSCRQQARLILGGI